MKDYVDEYFSLQEEIWDNLWILMRNSNYISKFTGNKAIKIDWEGYCEITNDDEGITYCIRESGIKCYFQDAFHIVDLAVILRDYKKWN